MHERIVPVIMAGGQGTRLWPLSRSARPKQFLPLVGETSLFQETVARVADADRYLPPVIITNADYRFLVAEQALEAGITPGAILLEPVARNTAAAIAAAAHYVRTHIAPDALLHVLASDHAVDVDENYRWSLEAAARAARAGHLVTFGITPTAPETGYGYIEAGPALGEGVARVARFVEKPDHATAESMLAAGGYYWNSGTFMLGLNAFLAELDLYAPEVSQAAAAAVAGAHTDLDFVRLDAAGFALSPTISVDYAVFEKSANVALVPVTYPWSDLGAWDAVWKISPKDKAGNASRGPVTLVNSTNTLVVTERVHVAVDGLDDIAVIATDDVIPGPTENAVGVASAKNVIGLRSAIDGVFAGVAREVVVP